MSSSQLADRVKGALMGAFVGDALGMGVHWYYDLDQMRQDYGEYVKTYQNPKPGRYHDQLKAGDTTQAGYILKMTLSSLIANKGYNEQDICDRFDNDLFKKMDGTPTAGPGGYTSQSIRGSFDKRKEGLPWGSCAGDADTTEALERTIAYGVYYASQPAEMCDAVFRNSLLTQKDALIVSLTVAFNALLGRLVCGDKLDPTVSDKLMDAVHDKTLPFHAVTRRGNVNERPADGSAPPLLEGMFSSPDALLTPKTCAMAAVDPNIRIEPAWRAVLVYGLPCAAYHVLPATYYLGARFYDNFEEAVCSSVNGGGQNCARTMLTGALVGAQTGLSGIPSHYITDLTESKELLQMVDEIADLIVKH